MLKKISNWTFGSIFRTIGRFLAYIIIGILISLIFLKREYVKAMTMDGQLVEEVHLFNSDWKYITVYRTNGSAPGGNYQTRAIYFDSDMYYHNTDADYLVMSWKSYFEVEDQVTEHQYYGSSGSGMYTWTNYDTKVIQVIPRVQLIAETGSWSTCELQNNLIVCPIFKNQTYTGLQFEAFMPQDDGVLDVNWYIGLNPWANTYRTNTNSMIQAQENSTNTIINNQNQQHNETMQVITGEVNGTGQNGTITDTDAMQNSCGLICKLKHLIKMLSIDNIKYLVVPTEEQMNDLFEQMQNKITSKLGILGLPVTVYTRLMQIAMQYDDTQQNWCLTWDNVEVPNFEDFNIIQGGQWCFSDILQNQKINAFRTVCMSIIGGLILLSFIQYLYNCLHRILDVPIQENYEYITTEDVINYDTFTGEVNGRQHRTRTTKRVEVDN